MKKHVLGFSGWIILSLGMYYLGKVLGPGLVAPTKKDIIVNESQIKN